MKQLNQKPRQQEKRIRTKAQLEKRKMLCANIQNRKSQLKNGRKTSNGNQMKNKTVRWLGHSHDLISAGSLGPRNSRRVGRGQKSPTRRRKCDKTQTQNYLLIFGREGSLLSVGFRRAQIKRKQTKISCRTEKKTGKIGTGNVYLLLWQPKVRRKFCPVVE
jgi:hypothetical protein